MRQFLAASIIAIFATCAVAEEASIWVMGMGHDTCSSFLQDELHQQQGEAWLAGWWSGMNYMNEEDHRVGHAMDSITVMSMIRHECLDNPSHSLLETAASVYVQLQKAAR